MANSSRPICPFPFINELDWPATRGYIDGRLCARITSLDNASCCVPCPLQDYVYSDSFGSSINAAFWISVPSLIMQIFLMLTFLILPSKDSHGHYLNWGITISVAVLTLCMVVPLAAKPEMCYDPVTPNDMNTSQTCAWSGSFLLLGAMGIVAWILVRSLYTHLRVVWSIELPRWYPLLSHAIGWGLPILFLAISLPITGVSYQIGPLCLPKKYATFTTWFGWYLTFSSIAGLIQLSTTAYCVWVYAASFRHQAPAASSTVLTSQSTVDEAQQQKHKNSTSVSGMYGTTHRWRRVKQVLLLQWRSILLSVLVVGAAIYFGAIYTFLANTTQQQLSGANNSAEILTWATCLVLTGGDKVPCLGLASALGMREAAPVAAFVMVSLVGIFTFLLMVRSSMFVAWYHVLRDPKRYLHEMRRRKDSIDENFEIMQTRDHADTGRDHELLRPDAGDPSQRHETTSLPEEQPARNVSTWKSEDETLQKQVPEKMV